MVTRIGPSPAQRGPLGLKPPPASLKATEAEMIAFLDGCANGDWREVEWFMKYRPEQWGCNCEGKVGLIYAAENGRDGIVTYLLDKEFSRYANVNAVSNAGMTALLYAAKGGHKKTLEILLKNQARTNVTDNARHSPLHFAVGSGSRETLEILLPLCAGLIDLPDNGGVTALWRAASMGNTAAVRLLLDAGACLDCPVKGASPGDIAKRGGHAEIVEMLKDEPARRDAAFSATIEGGIDGALKLGKAFRLVKKKEPEKKPDDKKDLPARAGLPSSPSVAPQWLTPARKSNFP